MLLRAKNDQASHESSVFPFSGAANMVEEEEEEIQEEMQESVPTFEDMQSMRDEGENGDDVMQEDMHVNGS